jgi:hypothetical protein
MYAFYDCSAACHVIILGAVIRADRVWKRLKDQLSGGNHGVC